MQTECFTFPFDRFLKSIIKCVKHMPIFFLVYEFYDYYFFSMRFNRKILFNLKPNPLVLLLLLLFAIAGIVVAVTVAAIAVAL